VTRRNSTPRQRIDTNIGFGGRMFLTKPEWNCYIRRKPVRYIKKAKPENCEICGKPASPDNPLQNAHIIGFTMGVTHLGLTPEFLDGDENIVAGHRTHCNAKAELSLEGSCLRLKTLGADALPDYLPQQIQEAWS
jgi:hypothetical protein